MKRALSLLLVSWLSFTAAFADSSFVAPSAIGQASTPLSTTLGGSGVAGSLTGARKANGASADTQAACGDLSNGGSACQATTGAAAGNVPLNTGPSNWTPADSSGASLALTVNSARYTQIGNLIIASASITYPSTASTAVVAISGLPVTAPNISAQFGCIITYAAASTVIHAAINQNSQVISFSTAAGASVQNIALSGTSISLTCVYTAS